MTSLRIGQSIFRWGERTYLMGIINVTPDSFSGDGFGNDLAAAALKARRLSADGADILDIGGESTRPGAALVEPDEELRRVLPAINAIKAAIPTPISIDTRKAAVASAAVAAGASLVNDVSGLGDPHMAETVAALGVPVVLTAASPQSVTNVVQRVLADLETAIARAARAGIPRGRLILDPGFGFGKSADENLELLRRLPELQRLGLPLLVGLSRKRTIARVLGEGAHLSEAANAALTSLAIAGGADIVRVHDVASARHAARLADAVVRGGGTRTAKAETGE